VSRRNLCLQVLIGWFYTVLSHWCKRTLSSTGPRSDHLVTLLHFDDVTSGSHATSCHAQWYILYYYYSKKKTREKIRACTRDHFRSCDFRLHHFRSRDFSFYSYQSPTNKNDIFSCTALRYPSKIFCNPIVTCKICVKEKSVFTSFNWMDNIIKKIINIIL
jgi:hypothetical protein